MPRIAVEASSPPATARTCGIRSSAVRTPTKMITPMMLRRRTRYRVTAPGASSRFAIRMSTSFARITAPTITAPTTIRRVQSTGAPSTR